MALTLDRQDCFELADASQGITDAGLQTGEKKWSERDGNHRAAV